ncbi:cytochrome c oxidase subunit 3 [Ralstonia mannitolilytica]|uniref:Cytochrome c oxidase subunit 3 n=1 Tax=Ralstonia mannitolilytica TaxID=105219 RepID=A0AAD2ANB4_9RALS|nr:cytochrome c oxidase subunit 3 [Ralstonia mannitolilytica]ANA35102.1 cytochrome oxidase subunit III [Ralstonia mannitolilytica]MBY4717058.1 cytochrome c oxidase subunit 3 [Ralstonia mannitolilytica]CAJ0680409.1 Cytochrome c oxidase subunit 3 [Ralstonia mannitolilytica]CAJ0684482.1 Cytochrome c oxidase subunit 3 [Ralstonia mannitolilytica]CAJ0685141.1 Cytochrome c oxidase subunit 3 [Ralstonia mannitolilytica]
MTTLPRHFVPDTGPALPNAGRVGLRVFMAVATALFSLLILAYAMRMREPDWMPVPHPMLLWWNTGALVLASLAMAQARRTGARQAAWLLAGGALAALFVFGQWMAWQQLSAHGEGVTVNPSNSFLYVFTGLHAAHVLGGLVAWGITVARLNADRERVHRAITLCATYWHFLLAVWLVLLAAMWWITPEFVAAICGPLYGAAP